MSARKKRGGFNPPRFDSSFRHQSSNAANILNATVYPTGVRTKTLEKLHKHNEASFLFGFANPKNTNNVSSARSNIINTDTKSPAYSPRFPYTPRSSGRQSSLSTAWITNEQKQIIPDVRDHMYINTYCPNERPMRYNELTLPRLSQERPWSVSESNPSKRVNMQYLEQEQTQRLRPTKPRVRQGWTTAHQNKQHSSSCGTERIQIRGSAFDDEVFPENTHKINIITSDVLQRPMKSEHGRYRPFSTVSVKKSPRTPRLTAQISHSPKRFVSVDQYMKYVENKIIEDRIKDNCSKTCPKTRFNTSLSDYQDSTIRALQSVMDVNRPISFKGTSSTSSSSSSSKISGS